uniref:Uncharacterized protein n=1 Tax=Meloidogyne javanica TaxID=6303 RepID=A0A915LHY2_MELJA
MEWSQKLSAFEDQATTQLLKHIYSDRNSKCEKDSMAIETIQKFKEDKGKLNMKILHCACILLGNEQTSQLFAQFIHAAKNEKELTNFLSFALTVIPHLNQNQRVNSLSVMTLAVRFAVLDSKKIENGLTEFLQEKEEILLENENCQNKITLERNLLNNLLMIVKWNEQSEQGMILRNIGLNLADIRGYLQEGLLNWMLDYTDLEAAQVLNTFFTLMLSVVPQVQLPLNFQNNLLTKLSALIVSMLKFIKKEKLGTSLDGVDYFARCCTIAGRIFIKQTGADPTQLMRSLMDEIFEHSIFQELRQASLTDRTAAAVAHSGTLNRKRFLEKFVENKEGEEEENAEIKINQIRRLLFLDFIECLCLSARPSTTKPSPPSTTEQQQMQQYTKITKIIEQHPIVFDFLLLLSELGFTGLCSVLPLFKALFVTADIFPRILSTFQKILSNSTNFEAFVLMRDLWDFLKLLIPTCEEITKGKMISFENKTVLEKREGKQLISSIVLVIQRNISLLGEFLYPILELICENDENDWTIEREQKPISVLAEIKRF